MPAERSSNTSVTNPTTYYDVRRASKDYVPAPRASAERQDGRVVALRQRSPPRNPRDDDYVVRPRIRTNSLDPGDSSSRRPLSMINPRSPNRSSRPVIIKEVERPSSPLSKTSGAQLEASYIMPASSSSGRNHHRHSSLTAGDSLPIRDRERERIYPGGRTSTAMRPPPPRSGRDDRDYAYEYTTPKDEVLRDLAPPQQRRPRRGSYTSARPTSMINFDRSDKIYARTDRDAPPPSSTKTLDSISRNESLRQSGRPRDDDLARRESISRGLPRDDRDDVRYRDIPRPQAVPREEYIPYPAETSRHQRPRKPTMEGERAPLKSRDPLDDRVDREGDRPRRHHHHHRDPELRRDYDGRDERERRKDYDDRDRRVREEPRERYDKGEEPSSHAGLLAAGGVATAAGAVAEGARRHRHKEEDIRPTKDPQVYPREAIAENDGTKEIPEVDDREERRRRRRRERERDDRDYREAEEETQRRAQGEGDVQRLEPPPATDQTLREQSSYERRPTQEEERPARRPSQRSHHRRHRSRTHDTDSYTESSESSDSDSSLDRTPRAPRVVTPSNDSSDPNSTTNAALTIAKPAPKSILKQPRVKFPEEPPTIREGVAPLDAAKKGIPPEARWTRVNRRLVNPEALEQEGVRFEEFPDHVIVLKVLSQEEIARFTQRTHEIRERRRQGQGSEGSGSAEGGTT